MPEKDGVGYGECTGVKLDHLSRILAMHLAITQAVLNKNRNLYRARYRYIELTAGKGFNPDGQKGSPLIFLDQAESKGFDLAYRADFIECEQRNLDELESAVRSEKAKNGWHCADLHFLLGRYQEVVPALLPARDTGEFGLVFADPSGDPPDCEPLRYVAEVRPKIEILMYLSSTNIKRIFQYTGKRLSDKLREIGKQYWLVRNPISWDKLQWTFLLGSNTDLFKDYRAVSFFRLDSKQGQAILEKLDLTGKERLQLRQPKLL